MWLIFVNIPELLRGLVWDINVHCGITAAPYIVFKRLNANVVRNIRVPLQTGAAAAKYSIALNLFFFLCGNCVCVCLLDPLSLKIWALKCVNLTDEENYRSQLQRVTPAGRDFDVQTNLEHCVFCQAALH